MHTPICTAPVTARLRARRLPALTIAAATALTGCYDYRPPASGTPQPGVEVRAMLTDAGSLQIAPIVGPRVASLDGRVERAGSDSLVLRVHGITMMSGEDNGWSGERLAIPASAVSMLREKQLSRSRTVLAAIVGVGMVVAVVLANHHGTGDAPPIQGELPPVGQYRATGAP